MDESSRGLDYSELPESLQDGMRRYIEEGILPGGFLTAVLMNDLAQAVRMADAQNMVRLWRIAHWVLYNVPSEAWGSPETVQLWVKWKRKLRDVGLEAAG